MNFHLEIHPALLSEELKAELMSMPKGLLHLEAGIQSLREIVLTTSRRAGKLEDAMKGLKFLCSLENMETHADLIAGLPHYNLNEIFEDVRTLAELNAGEIQLESLKLLPGTEMRRRAEELDLHTKYSKRTILHLTNYRQPDSCQGFWTVSTMPKHGRNLHAD